MNNNPPFKINDVIQNDVLFLAIIFCMTFLASFLRYMLMRRKQEKYTFIQILISSMVLSFLLFFSSDFLKTYLKGKSIFIAPIIAGLVAMDIINKLSSLHGIRGMLKFTIDILEFVKNRRVK